MLKLIRSRLPLYGEELVNDRLGKSADWFVSSLKRKDNRDSDIADLTSLLRVGFLQSNGFPIDDIANTFGQLVVITGYLNISQNLSNKSFEGQYLEAGNLSLDDRIFWEGMMMYKACVKIKASPEQLRDISDEELKIMINTEYQIHSELEYSPIDCLRNFRQFLNYGKEGPDVKD
jgi:hypothetical protein